MIETIKKGELNLAFRPGTSDVECLVEIFDKEGYKRLKKHFGDGTVLDLGGYVGYFALWAVANGAKKVVSYEPDPVSADIFRQNLALNPNLADCIELRQKAVAEENGQRLLYIASRGRFWRNTIVKEKKFGAVPVETQNIKEVLSENWDCIKADIEGMEKQLIFSLNPENKQPPIILEYSFDLNPEKSEYEACETHLRKCYNTCSIPKITWGENTTWPSNWVPPARIIYCSNQEKKAD